MFYKCMSLCVDVNERICQVKGKEYIEVVCIRREAGFVNR